EKVLQENADRIPAEVKTEVEARKEALNNAIKGGDVGTLRRSMDEFNEALQKVGQAVYQEAGAAGRGSPQQPGAGGQQGEDDVVDAEYREDKWCSQGDCRWGRWIST